MMYRRNGDEGARAAERERRALGFDVGSYIRYLLEQEREPGMEWEFHDVDFNPMGVSGILDRAFGPDSVVSYEPVAHWHDLTHHNAYDGDFESFTYGDDGTTVLVAAHIVLNEIRNNADTDDPDVQELIRELDSLNLRGVNIGF